MSHIKSFVIRQARMSDSQKYYYASVFPEYEIPYEEKDTYITELAQEYRSLVIEIGFGMGDATVEIAAQMPDTLFIGIEVHKPGIGKLSRKIKESAIHNVRIIERDAIEVFRDMIKPGFVDGIHVFFPDPWPKKKHHKRRLLKVEFLSLLADRLKTNGYLFIATDWEDYASSIELEAQKITGLSKIDHGAGEIAPYRPATAFEKKAVAVNRSIHEFIFRKI